MQPLQNQPVVGKQCLAARKIKKMSTSKRCQKQGDPCCVYGRLEVNKPCADQVLARDLRQLSSTGQIAKCCTRRQGTAFCSFESTADLKSFQCEKAFSGVADASSAEPVESLQAAVGVRRRTQQGSKAAKQGSKAGLLGGLKENTAARLWLR